MRPTTFDSGVVRRYLRAHKIANLAELKEALGTTADITVFRKLRPLDYLTSYTHRGSYYTLAEIARFDDQGLWSHEAVWFSRYGTLLSTIEAFIQRSDRGFLACELADALHAEVHDALRQLRARGRLRHTDFNGQFLYTSLFKCLLMNCKRRFSCFTAYWTSNNDGFMPGWNPSGLAAAGIPSSPISSRWIPIPSHEAASSFSIGTSLLAARAAAVAAEHRRKKNARNNCLPGGFAGR